MPDFGISSFLLLLYLAETYGILIHFMGLFVNVSPSPAGFLPCPAIRGGLPTVDILIPTYDEDVEVCLCDGLGLHPTSTTRMKN